jgi:hypothetical protein
MYEGDECDVKPSAGPIGLGTNEGELPSGIWSRIRCGIHSRSGRHYPAEDLEIGGFSWMTAGDSI